MPSRAGKSVPAPEEKILLPKVDTEIAAEFAGDFDKTRALGPQQATALAHQPDPEPHCRRWLPVPPYS